MTPETSAGKGFVRTRRIAGGVGLLALALAGAGAAFGATAFFQGYLFAWMLCAGPLLGAAPLLMVHDLTGGRWGWSIHAPLRGMVLCIPLACLLFVPLLLGVGVLYPWASRDVGSGQALVEFRSMYLEAWFFYARTIAYLVIWGAGALVLWRRSDPASVPSRRLAAGGLVVHFLTVSFAFYDWIATLEASWYSSIYGMYTIIGQVVAALGVSIVLVGAAPALAGPLDADRFHDLGNLLLAAVVLWAYVAFSQFFIVWNGDLPEQAEWYERRTRHGWELGAGALIVLHFFLPFAALLFRATKRRRRSLTSVACVVLGAHAIDVAWRVLPAYEEVGVRTLVAGVLGAGGISGCVVWLFLRGVGSVARDDEGGRA